MNRWLLLLSICTCMFIQSAKTQLELVEDDSSSSGSKDDELIETQHALCQINTLQLAATAKATVTRALKGVCIARSMDEHFKKVEKLLKNQLELLKELENKMDFVVDGKVWKSGQKSESIVPTTPKLWEAGEYEGENVVKKIKRIPRELEIKQYNSTVFQERNGKSVFTYYWRLHEIDKKLFNKKVIRSSNFYITPGGYCMYMRLLTTQNGDTIYIQVGLTHGTSDETLLWPFRLKHQLSVLDQILFNYHDIQSRAWDPSVLCSDLHWQKPSINSDNYECVGLGISNDTLYTRYYLLSNTLIVKLTVYL